MIPYKLHTRWRGVERQRSALLERRQPARCVSEPHKLSDNPCIILVEPTMGENIGAAARAMKNFGLRELRLVAPRDGWPNPLAASVAAGAQDVVQAAVVYPSVEAAIADLQVVYAATARPRAQGKRSVSARRFVAEELRSHSGARVGILFGREASGLTNQEVGLAQCILCIDAHPTYPVLNLGQAVLLVCYELWGAAGSSSSSSSDACDRDGPSPEANTSWEHQRKRRRRNDGGGSPAPATAAQVGSPAEASTPALLDWRPATAPGPCPDPSPSPGSGGPSRAAAAPHPEDPCRGSGQGEEEVAGLHRAPGAADAAADSAAVAAGAVDGGDAPPPPPPGRRQRRALATKGEVEGLLARVFSELEPAGFYDEATRTPSVQLSIRNLLTRVEGLSLGDLALLHGMLSKLAGAGAARRAALLAAQQQQPQQQQPQQPQQQQPQQRQPPQQQQPTS